MKRAAAKLYTPSAVSRPAGTSGLSAAQFNERGVLPSRMLVSRAESVSEWRSVAWRPVAFVSSAHPKDTLKRMFADTRETARALRAKRIAERLLASGP